VILSFFGKSFDRHRLEDKMRLHGVVPPFAERIHLDLYYPLRRAHRGQVRELPPSKRSNASSSASHAPTISRGASRAAAWFDFLALRPHRLEGVFRHNRDDVLSLVTLAAHVARLD
jgi:uncharacterized protein YprB with RNaseH-like and TPR domain